MEQFLQNKRQRQLSIIFVSLDTLSEKYEMIHSFFVDLEVIGISSVIKNEAVKYLKLIRDFGASSFLRRSWGHLSSYFMAN